ncbi:MAG: D-tyrosyl-tRNA(Tyr) deacylase [Alphaproteobacteria bacterium]|nr:D-tyrosyl-tRNA(Tyr) deacylase [Alphaproteobacteria bacterium]
MRALIQRVGEARVTVGAETIGAISRGLLILLGVAASDGEREAEFLARRIAALRILADDAGKMNRSVVDAKGGALVVSQFTLCADLTRGNRPGFSYAARPEQAEALYGYFCDQLASHGVPIACGRFGADMQVGLVNDGPVTIWMDTAELMQPGAS